MLHKPTLLAFRQAIEAVSGLKRKSYDSSDCLVCAVGTLGIALGYPYSEWAKDCDEERYNKNNGLFYPDGIAFKYHFDVNTVKTIEAFFENWHEYRTLAREDLTPREERERVLKFIDDQLALIAEHEALESPMPELVVV